MVEGTVYWLMGLSGAGKTTIGKILYKKLCEQKNNIVFLDGDTLREVFGNDLGYGKEDWFKGAMRYSRLCKLLSEQGQDVVICTISMFHEVRKWNKNNIEKYKEIYIDVSIRILQERNQKNLYKNGNNVVGLDLWVELPDNPDGLVVNDGKLSPEMITSGILKKLYI